MNIKRNYQHMVQKTKTNKLKTQQKCVGHHYEQANTNNVNKTRAPSTKPGGKNEESIVFSGHRNGDHNTVIIT